MTDQATENAYYHVTRAAAWSADTLMISAVLHEDNYEAIYQPARRVFQYEHKNQPGEQWFSSCPSSEHLAQIGA